MQAEEVFSLYWKTVSDSWQDIPPEKQERQTTSAGLMSVVWCPHLLILPLKEAAVFSVSAGGAGVKAPALRLSSTNLLK